MNEFLVKELVAIENLIFFMFEYIFNPKCRRKQFERLHEMVYPGLSALMEIFL